MQFNLKTIRKSRNISQTQLATQCELTIAGLQNYERGVKKQYSHELLEKFCNVLQCSPGELFTLESE